MIVVWTGKKSQFSCVIYMFRCLHILTGQSSPLEASQVYTIDVLFPRSVPISVDLNLQDSLYWALCYILHILLQPVYKSAHVTQSIVPRGIPPSRSCRFFTLRIVAVRQRVSFQRQTSSTRRRQWLAFVELAAQAILIDDRFQLDSPGKMAAILVSGRRIA